MRQKSVTLAVVCAVLFSWVTAAIAATSVALPAALKTRMAQAGLPYAEWPRAVPGEGILLVSEGIARGWEAKYGLGDISLREFGRLPLSLKAIERVTSRQFRMVWENEVWGARISSKLEALRFEAMRQALSSFGALRPVSISHPDQAGGDAGLPNDPLAGNQPQHGWVGTLRFQQELGRRPNRVPGWTVVSIDSGMAPIDTPEPDARSKSFVEEGGAPGDQKYYEDFGRHGTFLAQVMGGRWGNQIGGYGIGKIPQIWVLKTFIGQLDERGIRRTTANEVDCLKGFQYLRDNLRPGEFVVVNVSWSFLGSFIGFHEVFADLDGRAIFVTSAGNVMVGGYPDPMYPSTIETPNNLPVCSLEPNGVNIRGKFGYLVKGCAVGVNLLTTFGFGSGSSYVVPQYVAVIYELSREDARIRPWDITAALMRGPVIPDERNIFGITRLDPLVSLVEIRRLFPLPPPPKAPTVVRFAAEPDSIQQGQTTLLEWQTADASQVEISPTLGRVGASGSELYAPGQTMTFTLTVRGEGGQAQATVTVTVRPAPEPPPVPPPEGPIPPPPRSRQRP